MKLTSSEKSNPKYHLVAHKALFTGLPSIGIFDEESKASVKAQLALKFMEYGNPEPLVFTGTMDEIRGKLRDWAKQNNFKYSEQEIDNKLAFTVTAE